MVSWGKIYFNVFLGKRPESIIKKISQKHGIPIVNMLDEKVYEHYITGVDEFIWTVEHAALVYTDSFLCTEPHGRYLSKSEGRTAAGEHLPQGKPMGVENGPEAAFRASVGNLAQRRADPPSGPSG